MVTRKEIECLRKRLYEAQLTLKESEALLNIKSHKEPRELKYERALSTGRRITKNQMKNAS